MTTTKTDKPKAIATIFQSGDPNDEGFSIGHVARGTPAWWGRVFGYAVNALSATFSEINGTDFFDTRKEVLDSLADYVDTAEVPTAHDIKDTLN